MTQEQRLRLLAELERVGVLPRFDHDCPAGPRPLLLKHLQLELTTLQETELQCLLNVAMVMKLERLGIL